MIKATATELDFVRKLLRDEAGLLFGEDKEYLLDSKLRALARHHRLSTVSELIQRLRDRSNAALRRAMIEELLVSETYFFRDGHPFETIRSTLLPELIQRRAGEAKLHVWCAAASTGQEPYSLAIVLEEAAAALSGWSVRLLATDLSGACLERARGGLYSEGEMARGMTEPRRSTHFEREEGGWRARPALRRKVELTQMNLIGDWPVLPRMDLVLLRNVLIYFDAPTRAGILQQLRGVLRPGGYLLLGTTETLVDAIPGLTPVRLGPTVCYRRD